MHGGGDAFLLCGGQGLVGLRVEGRGKTVQFVGVVLFAVAVAEFTGGLAAVHVWGGGVFDCFCEGWGGGWRLSRDLVGTTW